MQLDTGTVIDRYAVEDLIGQGGMAVVYRVRHQQLGTLHALKVLMLPARSIRERLIQEGQVQARLRHPNIISVTDLVDVDGAPGLVMEYVPGPSLDGLLRQAALTVDQADLLARGLLEGVAAAHDFGLVHRDLKPGNVLLEVRKDRLIPKITDFGLVKLVGDDDAGGSMKTRSGLAMGTPCYMAPEQIRNAKGVDARADVFSLGALLYELVTGQRAFDGEDTFEIFSAVTSGYYEDPRALAVGVPDRMANAIAAAMKTDRDERAQSVEALLQLWTDGTPAPLPSVAFAPALLERAAELGSGGTDAPIGTVEPVTPPPSVAQSSDTMDWSLDAEDEPPSASPAAPVPAPRPQPQAQQGSNRGPVMRRFILLGAAVTSVSLAGVLAIGVVGGGALWTLQTSAPPEVAAMELPADLDEDEDETEAKEMEEAPPEEWVAVAQPLPAPHRRVDVGSGAGIAAGRSASGPSPAEPVSSTAPEPAPPPVPSDLTVGGEDPEAGSMAADVAEEPEVGDDEVEPVEEEVGSEGTTEEPAPEPEPDLPTGTVVLKVAYHPITPGAEGRAEVWLVGEHGRFPPGSVPAGEYQVEALFSEKGSPIKAGTVRVPVGGSVILNCYTSTQACKVRR